MWLENWGSGAKRIIEACQEQGVEEPTWRWDGAFIYITFKRPVKVASNSHKDTIDTVNDTAKDTVNDTAKLILKAIGANPRITYKEIVDATSISRATVARYISKLTASGFLIRHGADKNGYWEIP